MSKGRSRGTKGGYINTMKLLTDFCQANKLKLIPTTYNFKNYKFKGYDIVKPGSMEILIAFEPMQKSDGTKWYVRFAYDGFKGPRYLKSITKSFLSTLDLSQKSSYRLIDKSVHIEDGTISKLSKIKKGEFFKLEGGKTVYVYDGKLTRGFFHYHKFDDANAIHQTKTDRSIIIDFTF